MCLHLETEEDFKNNTGFSDNDEVSDDVKLERVKKAVEEFSKLPDEWWEFWENRAE